MRRCIAVVLLIAAVSMFVSAHLRARHGLCEFGTPPLEQVRNWLLNNGNSTWTYVFLSGPEFTHEWLERSNHLRSLRIESLNLQETSLSGMDIENLLDAHPVHCFVASGSTGMDQAASALGRGNRARMIRLSDTDLTDAGLCQLPLEKIEELDIVGTAVTPLGIDALRRCSSLLELSLDGSQIDDRSVQAISAIHSLEVLEIDRKVTDRTVKALEELQMEKGRLRLDNTQISDEQVATLHAVLRQKFLKRVP